MTNVRHGEFTFIWADPDTEEDKLAFVSYRAETHSRYYLDRTDARFERYYEADIISVVDENGTPWDEDTVNFIMTKDRFWNELSETL